MINLVTSVCDGICSGGGLISGVATALKGRYPSIKVYGAEPAAADDAFRSKAEGRLIKQYALFPCEWLRARTFAE
jgi:threonine dehydratase